MKQNFLSYYIRIFLTQFLPNERGLSENTILAYRDVLKLLLQYCDERLNLRVDRLPCDRINDKIVRGFLDYLEQQRRCCTRSRNARLAALKTFFYYLGDVKCLNV
jgi:integrase/recombinase XerD